MPFHLICFSYVIKAILQNNLTHERKFKLTVNLHKGIREASTIWNPRGKLKIKLKHK